MKRTGFKLITAFLIFGTFYSCFDMNTLPDQTREDEQVNLKNYIANLISAGNDVDTTDLGVYYITFDKGTGPFPKKGDTLTVGYAGYFSNGYKFDASAWNGSPDSTLTFVLGNPPMIKGWENGMTVINKNAKVQLIMSSDLAYGSKGAGVIPPYQTVVFVVIMKNIKPC